MAVQVRLPAMLGGATLAVADARTLDDVARFLRELRPDLAARLDDAIFNFAVNDEMLIHADGAHQLHDGDIVEIVPAIAGGQGDRGTGGLRDLASWDVP